MSDILKPDAEFIESTITGPESESTDSPTWRLDPHDPLNWSPTQKFIILLTTAVWSFIGTAFTTIVAPALQVITDDLGNDFSVSTYLVGGPILAYGVTSLIWVPLGNRFGVRFVFVGCALVAGLLSIWGAKATSFSDLAASRTLANGFFASPETLGPQMVGDVFFMEDRAKALTFICVFQAGGFSLGPLLGSYILRDTNNWRWLQWTSSIISLALAVVLFLCYPETQYNKSREGRVIKRRMIDNFRFWPVSGGGKPKVQSFITAFIYPFNYLPHPIVIVNTIYFSLCLVVNAFLLTIQAITYQTVFGFDLAESGLTYLAPAIGTWMAIFFSGIFSDWLMGKYKNFDGTQFPERRLLLLIGTGTVYVAGTLIYGLCVQAKTHWALPLIGSLFIGFGFVTANSISFAYLLDVYEARTDAVMVIFHSVKNFAAFGITFAIVPWITASGYAVPFGVLTSILVFAHLLLFSMYWLGPYLRSWSMRKFKTARPTHHGDIF
ncbi:hypothetical protein B7463_g9177, partial [Scytalidium lignicola]